MNLNNYPLLLVSIVLFGLIALVLLFILPKTIKNLLITALPLSLFFIIALFGYVENEANGAKVNQDGSITLYSVYKKEAYTTKIKRVGATKIRYTSNTNYNKLNKRIKIKRNIINGTLVETYKDKKALRYEEK